VVIPDGQLLIQLLIQPTDAPGRKFKFASQLFFDQSRTPDKTRQTNVPGILIAAGDGREAVKLLLP